MRERDPVADGEREGQEGRADRMYSSVGGRGREVWRSPSVLYQ